MNPNIGSAERDTLARLADILIPASDMMPSASHAGVAGAGLDALLVARPDLLNGLTALLRQLQGQSPTAAIDSLRSSDPASLQLLGEIVAGAYFMNPDVRTAINYHGQTARPASPEPEHLDEDLLAPLLRRGPIYRPTPG